MKKLAIIAPAVMATLLTTGAAHAFCEATVVNTLNESTVYICRIPAPQALPVAIAPPPEPVAYDYTPKPKAKVKKKTKKCWYTNKRGKKRWRRC